MKGALKVCIYCCRFMVYFPLRTREQTQARLGAEANASGGRDGRVWEQRRMQTGRSSLTSWEFVFTRHPGGGPLRVWFALHQACRPRLASESKLTDGSYNISKSVGKIILNLPRALFFDLKRSTNWEQSIKLVWMHCRDSACVMSFSAIIEDDAKSYEESILDTSLTATAHQLATNIPIHVRDLIINIDTSEYAKENLQPNLQPNLANTSTRCLWNQLFYLALYKWNMQTLPIIQIKDIGWQSWARLCKWFWKKDRIQVGESNGKQASDV